VHFRMRHAQRFDHIFDGAAHVKAARDGLRSFFGRQKVIQLCVEPHAGPLHGCNPSGGEEATGSTVVAFLSVMALRELFKKPEMVDLGMFSIRGIISHARMSGTLRLSATTSICRYTPPVFSSILQ